MALDRVVQAWAQQQWAGLLAGSGAHAAGAGVLDVDSGWMLDEWERELFERLIAQARGGSVRFVESSVGGGRTHFLQLALSRARTAGMATVLLPESCQIAVWKDPLELYKEIASGLSPGRSPGAAGLLPLLSATRQQGIARAELFPEFPSWGLAAQLWADQEDPAAGRFLLGLPLDGEAGERLGLHAAISPRQATAALRCLLGYLDFCQEPGLVVLGDGDGRIPESQERSTLESLRNLVDSCAGGELPGLLLVFAVLPEFRRQVLPEYEALQQRLHNGFSTGPAGCLRPILVLEEQRRWRASQGMPFAEHLFWRIHQLARRAGLELSESPLLLRRNLTALLEELPWYESSPGAARGLSRTLARWLAEPGLALDSCEPELYLERLGQFLEEEAL